MVNKAEQSTNKSCNCRNPPDCPLTGNCLASSIVYKATVNSDQGEKSYIGISDTAFKSRWNNHMSSFRLGHKRTQTALSKHIWHLKDNGTNFTIKWTVLKKTSSYSNVTKRCQLCLWEKYFIITADKSTTLNNRTELISKCRHANKFLLHV